MGGHFLVNCLSATFGRARISQSVMVSSTESDPGPPLELYAANAVHGDVSGVAVQAAVIHGGVRVGDVHVATVGSAMAFAVPVPDPRTVSAELFVGRHEQVQQVMRWLGSQADGSGTAVVSAVQGMGGIGKTTT